MRKCCQLLALVVCLVVIPIGVPTAATAATDCITTKVPVTNIVKVRETVHGKVKVVDKREDVKVSERVRVKIHGKWETVVREVVKTKTVQTCTTTAPVSATAPIEGTPTIVNTPPLNISPAPVLGASLDPSYTQAQGNPLEVTWSFSASATVNGQPDQSLPSGVLELFSGGSLVDSLNVGGSTTGGSYTVTYSNYGNESVDVVYASGTNSATTGVETYDIEPPPPVSTTTTETVTGGASNGFTTSTCQPGTTPAIVLVSSVPVTFAYVVDYSCTYTVTIRTVDANGNAVTSGISTNFCTPAVGQRSCTFTDTKAVYGESWTSGPPLPPPGLPNNCANVTDSLTATFAGNSTDAASSSAPASINGYFGCAPLVTS